MISIHAPHEGERQAIEGTETYEQYGISIHAPHEGERRVVTAGAYPRKTISIHAPHEGERLHPGEPLREARQFQSTLPTRGSDVPGRLTGDVIIWYFNPRSPRGGATAKTLDALITEVISIHAPHEGERRCPWGRGERCRTISIHAPHEGERRS